MTDFGYTWRDGPMISARMEYSKQLSSPHLCEMTGLSSLLLLDPKLGLVVVPVLPGPQVAQKPGGPAVADQGPSCLCWATAVLWEVLVDHRRDPSGQVGGKQASLPGALQAQYVLLLYHKSSGALVEAVPRVSISHQSSDGFVPHSLASCCLKGLHSFLIFLHPTDCRWAPYKTHQAPHSHGSLSNVPLCWASPLIGVYI